MQKRDRAFVWAIAALVGVGTLIRIPQLGQSLAEAWSFRQTQTAFTVKGYLAHGIDLLSSPVPVFGPDSTVPMEFPLFQGAAALLVQAGVPVDVAVRIVALIGFQAVAVLLAVLLVRWFGRAVAVVAVGLLQFLPFGMFFGATSLIDFTSVAFALLMVIGLDRWWNGGRVWWLVASSVGAVLGFLVKITSIPSWGFLVLASAIVVIVRLGWKASWKRLVLGVVVSPGIGFAAGVAWTLYADAVKRSQPIADLFTSSGLRDWNFGTLGQRLDPLNYGVVLERIAQQIAGPGLIGLLLAVVAAIMMPALQDRIRLTGLLAVVLSAPLVFFNLYAIHNYYLIAIYPAIVAAMAVGAVWLYRRVPIGGWRRNVFAVLAAVLLFTSTATSELGRGDLYEYATGGGRPAISSLLQDQTEPGDLIIMTGCNWDPTFLYYADRSGVMFLDSDTRGFWDSHDIADYSYLFACNAEPEPASVIPPGAELEPTGNPQFYRVVTDD
jgi:hypothetical protein